MIEIRSKINNRLLHMVYRADDLTEQREDVAPEDQFIQVSALDLKSGKTFRPHRHIWKAAPRDKVVAQESWCIICLLYTSPSPRDLSTSRMPSSA